MQQRMRESLTADVAFDVVEKPRRTHNRCRRKRSNHQMALGRWVQNSQAAKSGRMQYKRPSQSRSSRVVRCFSVKVYSSIVSQGGSRLIAKYRYRLLFKKWTGACRAAKVSTTAEATATIFFDFFNPTLNPH